MNSVGREHLRVGERASGTTRRTQPPTTTMSGAWVRHLQRVAEGGATSSSAGAGRETEAADRSQVQRTAVDEGLRSPTRPLDPALRGEMEQRFGGADFSGVRVHDGPVAQRAAAAVEARAFTSGAHIVDGGEMSRKDWAHELAHTLDQAAGPAPGTDNGAGLRISDPRDEGERRAVAAADQVMSARAPVQRLSAEHEHPSGHAEHDHAHPYAGSTFVQRVQQSAVTEEPVAEQAEGPEQSGQQAKGAEIITRLSQSIEQHTVQSKVKKNVFAPGTWWPEQWMVVGPARLRKTLDRRVMRGETFNDQDLDDIKHLSQANAQWLEAVGIGTYEQAEKYAQGRFDTWLTLPAGKRVLTATLAVRANHPDVREAGGARRSRRTTRSAGSCSPRPPTPRQRRSRAWNENATSRSARRPSTPCTRQGSRPSACTRLASPKRAPRRPRARAGVRRRTSWRKMRGLARCSPKCCSYCRTG